VCHALGRSATGATCQEQCHTKVLPYVASSLKDYPTEIQGEGPWHLTCKSRRKWIKYFLKKIRRLKAEKIVWPSWDAKDIWVISVDGTCWRLLSNSTIVVFRATQLSSRLLSKSEVWKLILLLMSNVARKHGIFRLLFVQLELSCGLG
jgi:hypothetical protein